MRRIPSNASSVSVIICTHNRAKSLEATLAALLELELGGIWSFEALIVDNASSDDTPAVIDAAIARASFPMRRLSERRAGLSHARNAGLQASSGDFILFTDDDCIVQRDWVRSAVNVLGGGPPRFVGGRVEPLEPDDVQVPVRTGEATERLVSAGQIIAFMHGANMAFTRSVVEKIGLFDVDLGAGTRFHCAEDTDYLYRALRAGVLITYEPSIVVFHGHVHTGPRDAVREARRAAYGLGAMAAKHAVLGRLDLLKPLYWDVTSSFRSWRRGATSWATLAARARLLSGAQGFLVRSLQHKLLGAIGRS